MLKYLIGALVISLCLIEEFNDITGVYVDNALDLGHTAVDQVAKKFGYHEPVYAVVIDAGSTGSRVLAFSFHKAYLGGYIFKYLIYFID